MMAWKGVIDSKEPHLHSFNFIFARCSPSSRSCAKLNKIAVEKDFLNSEFSMPVMRRREKQCKHHEALRKTLANCKCSTWKLTSFWTIWERTMHRYVYRLDVKLSRQHILLVHSGALLALGIGKLLFSSLEMVTVMIKYVG